MPKVARKNQADSVASPDGAAICCASPSTQETDEGSDDVFVNDIGAVRLGDAMKTHPYPGPCCVPHAPSLSSASTTVFVNGQGMGRLGDDYSAHYISSGSSNVYAGG